MHTVTHNKTAYLPALARRPGTPQVEQLSGARDGQSDEGAPARPMHHLLRNEEYRPETDGMGWIVGRKPARPD